MPKSIDQLVAGCARGFERLEQKPGYTTIVNVTKPDEIARFKTLLSRFNRWTRNAETHSLDQALQDNTRIKLQVIRLLSHIQRLLRDAHAITVGDQVPWDQVDNDEDSQSDDEREILENPPETEMEQILTHIADAIDNLLYLIPPLRRRLINVGTTDEPSPFETFDTQHVRSKYPEIDPVVAERLGKAISARRQLLKLMQDNQSYYFHSRKIPISELELLAEQITPEDPTHTNNKGNEVGLEISSVTSCSAEDDGRASRVPVLPQEATQGNSFRCVYCQVIINVSSEVEWKKHVYEDLQPYICLEEDCLTPRYQYARRKDWMKHVLEAHWRIYSCPFGCGLRSASRSQCIEHLCHNHGDDMNAAEIEDLVQLGTFNKTGFSTGTSCPFCKIELQDIKTYQNHVGEHQRRLALFALPLTSEDLEERMDEAGPSSVQGKKPPGQDEESGTYEDTPDRHSIGMGSHSGKDSYRGGSGLPKGQARRKVLWYWICYAGFLGV
ncbi:hypothetical protein FVEG_07772 [Fusarium verticillioides 7600]|uniref:C2H2-type domain-containing protein n=1 Tax=Gibberella moniliformis (strain M3125 / FGSC 7600) TaxID=334819 RepID=W7MJB1_GIBM7|nr:hypothetical protein FVEG_07772 [Fusarium verticillioides 7600]EWG47725.1 hypothetical protein FVEG_07772 [Fusarium verticillioides 7600]